MTGDLLLFRVGSELFATELRAVEEVVDLTAARHVSGVAGPARGVFTLRDAFVPLFSAARALGVSAGEAATALVVRGPSGRIAIAADDVEDVLVLRDGEVRPVPAGEAHDTGILRGVVRRGGELVTIVDLDALIAACRSASYPEAG